MEIAKLKVKDAFTSLIAALSYVNGKTTALFIKIVICVATSSKQKPTATLLRRYVTPCIIMTSLVKGRMAGNPILGISM